MLTQVQPYRVSPQAKTAIEWEIQDMFHIGVIRPSGSAWASPVVLVPKPDEEIHFCVDYRKLNAVTHPDNYPMPRTDELLEKLGRAQFISTLDLTKGYWQIPLDESAKERSAFTIHVGLYEFNVLPFRLRNAPATFQRLVDGLLAGLGDDAVAYLDVAIFSDSWAEHLEHLQKVFECIREAGLTVKAKKCQIGLNRVTPGGSRNYQPPTGQSGWYPKVACPKVKETSSMLLRLGRLLQAICTTIQPDRRPTHRPNQKETAKCRSVDRRVSAGL
ncbi:unnamed protein product [Lepidochelys kempii]